MMVADVLKELERERSCEVVTSWRQIPIRVKLSVRWVSPQERFISFDFKGCKFRHVFSDNVPVYIKVRELFLICKVFSNIRDELVLEVDSPVPAPPVVLREFIRVEPTEKEPVYVSFCVEDNCLVKTRAADISESGVGVLLSNEDTKRLVEILSQIATDASRIHTPFELEIELPREGVIRAQGELKNIISREGDVYVRLGFKINLREEQTRKIRQYIMRRQREILEQLKAL
ncbi:MAG: hypothetical protein ACK42C_04955 [Aquificaceae bacterium]|jgi:c-di-GMP-binding flagellar brake protein YcgR|uniref:hypothetical protein n=1 Tax=Hydrogenobacter sp. Uz 6-8 TaxID=3384828 RepID=UPI0030A0C7AE